MRRMMTVLGALGLAILVSYSFVVLLYDLAHMNFRLILDNALLHSPNIYHLIIAPVRSIGTVIAFILFIPFLRLFLVNSQIALAIFIVIQIAVLLVVHIALIAISLAYLNRALKNGERELFSKALDILLPGIIDILSRGLLPPSPELLRHESILRRAAT